MCSILYHRNFPLYLSKPRRPLEVLTPPSNSKAILNNSLFLKCRMALIITSTQALVLLAFLVLIITISRFFFFNKDSGFLKSQQVIGLRKEWFPWFRATALSIFETKNWAFEGYDKVSRPILNHAVAPNFSSQSVLQNQHLLHSTNLRSRSPRRYTTPSDQEYLQSP